MSEQAYRMNGGSGRGSPVVQRVAERYMRAGMAVIPLPPKAKNPNRSGWQNERPAIEDIPKLWTNGQGIGLLWGEPSRGRVDVDLDWPEARAAAAYLLPDTKTFGRDSSPRSHRVYRTEGRIPRTKRYKLPGDGDERSVVELLSTGTQSLVPPSVHESGEVRKWDKGRIARIDGGALEEGVADVATAALLARKWPGQGARHDYVLAATGYIGRRLPQARAERIMEAAIAAADDEESASRLRDVRDTLKRIADGTPATGGPILDQLAPGVPDVLRRWHRWGAERTTEDKGTAPSSNGSKQKLTANQIADAITVEDHFAQDAGGKLYRFSGGTYNQYAERYIRRRVKELLETTGRADEWSSYRASEVVEYIRADAPELWERPPLDEANLLNGILNVETHELREHDPEFLSPVQIPVSYDPDARCPAWEKFVAEVFPKDAQELPFEIAADLITPSRSAQKAILALGEGSNGKSTYLRAKTAFVGSANVAGASLHKLESDRFATARLIGKLANICPDLPSAHLAETSVFKAITGGDDLHAEYKYRESFEFRPYCRLVFSANHVPRSSDASHAFFRRWLVVPFNRTFEPDEQIPREELDARLADPKELSGVLNRALEVLPRVRREGFTESESMREAHQEFRAMTDPVAVWLAKKTVSSADAFVAKSRLLAAYNADCEEHGRSGMTATAFGLAVKRALPGIEDAQRTVNGKPRVKVWLGIGLRGGGDDGGADDGGGDPPEPPSNPGNPGNPVSLIVSKMDSEEGEAEIKPELRNRGNPVNPVTSVTPDPVRDFFAEPPDWLATQLELLRADSSLMRPTLSAISYEIFGTYDRRGEVQSLVEEILQR